MLNDEEKKVLLKIYERNGILTPNDLKDLYVIYKLDGNFTTCVIHSKFNVEGMGTSKCNPNRDVYTETTGKRIALTKAVYDMMNKRLPRKTWYTSSTSPYEVLDIVKQMENIRDYQKISDSKIIA